MERWNRQTLLVGLLIVGLSSAVLGGVLALIFFEPEPELVIQQVELAPTRPPLSPSPEDIALLVERYVELGGESNRWTSALVEEIGASVCDSGHSGTDLMQNLGHDIELQPTELDEFVNEVRLTCPGDTRADS